MNDHAPHAAGADSDHLLAAIMRCSRDAIIGVCFEGKILAWNEAAEELFGWPREEILDRHISLIVPEDHREEAEALIARVQNGESIEPLETVRRDRDGRRIPVSLALSPILDHDGDVLGASGIIRDISERKCRDEKLERSNRDLERFASIVTHDLQEPLRTVSSYAQLLERRYGDELDKKGRRLLEYLVEGSIRMQQMLHALLAYARVETRGRPFEPTDLDDVVDSACRNLAVLIRDNQAEIVHRNLPPISGDRVQLVHVFQNLIGNGIKFRGSDSPRLIISAVERDDVWEIVVQDNGQGIAPEHTDRIFEMFHRPDEHRRFPGVGVGLTIVKRIVERHAGSIRTEPSDNGARFILTFPRLRRHHRRWDVGEAP